MIAQHAAPTLSHARASAELHARGIAAALGRHWRNYRTCRATRAELAALTPREREDIGLAGADLDEVARRAVYEN